MREHFVRNAWRWKCGLPELPENKQPTTSVEVLRKTEWSPRFEQLMRNRLIFGAYRYGRMGHGKTPAGKPHYDRCESIRKRLQFFEDTGNAEWLVDIANMALLMFEEKQHKNFHFDSIDDGYHDNVIV